MLSAFAPGGFEARWKAVWKRVARGRDRFDGPAPYRVGPSGQVNMSLSHQTRYSDEQLARYLLQLLPEEDIDCIDELSIADEEMAWRLRVVEDDLVDTYVSGRLNGETLKQFEALYLTSDRRRQKVEFARSFLHKVDREAGTATARSRRWSAPRAMVPWSLAAAAALLLVCGGLVVRDVQLRNVLSQAEGQRAVLEQR